MPCFTPIKAYRAHGGGVVFDSKRGFADRPLDLRCGRCHDCRMERSRQWAIRMIHEAQMHERNTFVTLTYDKEHRPDDGGLRVGDFQRFCKRLRKRSGSFRFFHCGEYGPQNLRPHYHAILFGTDFPRDGLLRQGKTPLYISELLSEVWGMGMASHGAVTFQSAAYVARYVVTKATGNLAETRYSRVDPNTGECWSVPPEYCTMSRKPGLGATWIKKFASDVYPADEVVHQGQHYRPPRFYDATLDEQELLRVKAKRADQAAKYQDETTPERLRVREEVARLRLRQLTRDKITEN